MNPPISIRQLTLATLQRQHLLEPSDEPWTTVVRDVFALQGQEPASPFLALRARVRGLDADEVTEAILDTRLVKCSALRLTLHLLDAGDHGAVRAAMSPAFRAAALHDRRFTETGVEPEVIDRIGTELATAANESAIGKGEIDAILADRLGGSPPAGIWRALRYLAPLRHAADPDEPWCFGRTPRFRSHPALGATSNEAHTEGVAEVVARYLAAFGPATRRDIAQFTLFKQPQILGAIDRLGDRVVRLGGGGSRELIDVAEAPLPDDAGPPPARLLPMWDSTLLAYADRSRIIPAEVKPRVIRRNGDTLPAVLVDGAVRGIWRLLGDDVEITAFEHLDARAWRELAEEADDVRRFVGDRDPDLYGRYRRWWTDLEAVEVRRI